MVRYRIFMAMLLLTLVATLTPTRLDALSTNPNGEDDPDTKIVCDDMGRCTHLPTSSDENAKHSKNSSVAQEVDPDLEPGFPVKALHTAGTYQAGQSIHTLIGNIDSDPELEILATGIANGPLYAWNSDGTLVNGWPVTEPVTDTYRPAYPALGNLSDNYPWMEVATGYFYGTLVVYSGSGARLPGWPIIGSQEHPPVLVDVDSDGLDEIFVGGTDSMIHAYKADGSPLPGWPVGGTGSERRRMPAVGDLDGDGDLEIAVASGYITGGYTLYVYHHDGTPVDGFPIGFQGYTLTFPAIGDVDGDGTPEIIIVGSGPGGILMVSPNGTIERTLSITDRIFYGSAPALADLDGDSVPEIIVQANSSMYVWYGDGTTYPGWPVDFGGEYWLSNSSPVVGDVDGDQQPDIVITADEYYYHTGGEVRVYSHDGKLHPHFPKTVVYIENGAVPAIADIDLDGRNEIIITGCYWNGIPGYYDKVWVYDLGGGPHGRIEWGQLGGGPQHRGFYPPPPLVGGVDLYVDVNSIVPAPPDGLAAMRLRYGNHGATIAATATLTIALDSHLTYVDDTSGVTSEVSDTIVTWNLPHVNYYDKNEFTVYLQVTSGTLYGSRYPVTGSITSSSPDLNFSDNTFNTEIMIARRTFLPLIRK